VIVSFNIAVSPTAISIAGTAGDTKFCR